MPATTPPTVRKLSSHIGLCIEGVRLGGDLGAEMAEQIYRALLEHKVIFFRGQDHLDDAGQVAFARLLGDPLSFMLAGHPSTGYYPLRNAPLVHRVDSRYGYDNRWHSDLTFATNYPGVEMLRAVTMPPYGGSTLWTCTAAAYAALPEPLRRFAGDLWVVHTNRTGKPEYHTEHPLVRVHPDTGERTLVAGSFARGLVGLDDHESNVLLELMQRRITLPENSIRWDWQPGDVAIWDNRATQHRAVADYDGQQRLLHRVSLMGDVPVGVHGEHSRAIVGPPLEPSP
jgi:alpha-ketoglutarate-dependent taurine dioxygenase